MSNAPNSTVIQASCKLLSKLSVKHNPQYVEEYLKDHQFYPSLSCVADLLNDFRIDNVAVTIQGYQLINVPHPSMAYLPKDDSNGKFIVINSVSRDGSMQLYDPEIGEIVEDIKDFEAKWKGVLVLAEANGNSKSQANEDYSNVRKRKNLGRIFSAGFLFIVILTFVVYTEISISNLTLVLLTIIGLTASTILFLSDFGYNSLLEKVCTFGGLSKKNGCSKVTNSKAGILFGLLKMSELGLLYFTGSLIYLTILIFTDFQQNLYPFYILSILSLPYTLFSIFYQTIVVKQICPLCLVVVLVLWSIFGLLYWSNLSYIEFDQSAIAIIAFSFAVPVFFWFSVWDKIYESQGIDIVKKKLKYFSSSADSQAMALKANKGFLQGDPTGTITVNENGNIRIIAVLSLFCPSCSNAFQQIMEYANRFVNLRIDLLISFSDSASSTIVESILFTKMNEGDNAAIDRLKSWYSHSISSSNSKVSESYPTESQLQEIRSNIQKWNSWLTLNNINFTPAILINGTLKPNYLTLVDFEIFFRKYSIHR